MEQAVADEQMEDQDDSGDEQGGHDQGQALTEPQAHEPGMQLNRVDATDPRVQAVYKKLEDAGAKVFYEKVMTASDTAGSGRVVVPKVQLNASTCCPAVDLCFVSYTHAHSTCALPLQAIAEQYFPRLDQATGMPFSCLDIDGRMYTFKWR